MNLAAATASNPINAGRKNVPKLFRVVHNSGPSSTAHSANRVGREASRRSTPISATGRKKKKATTPGVPKFM